MSDLWAKIYRSSKREFDCKVFDTGEFVKAKALGNLLKEKEALVVGDMVKLTSEESTGEYIIVERAKRKNEVFRVIVREMKKKISAANVDYLVIVMSVSKPKFKRGLLDRYLVRAQQWEIHPLVVFNKMDEHKPERMDFELEMRRLEDLDLDLFETSAVDRGYSPQFASQGLSELNDKLKGGTAMFVGQSGVGKSQIISTLGGRDVELRTGEIGKAGKGSHTTTWSEIVDLNDFSLIDSPGIRSFSLDDIDPEELIFYFPDLAKLAGHCQFFDCQHLPETKGCAFWQKYDPATPKGEAILSRLESYNQLREEVAQIPHWQKNL